MNMKDQAVATEARPHSDTEVMFEQSIKGWSGSGFDYSHRTLEGVFWHSANVAQIKFSVTDHIGLTADTTVGTIVLTEKDAIKFALNIAPKEIRQKVDLFDDMARTLNDIKRTMNEGDDVTGLYYVTLHTLLDRVNNVGKD